MTAISCALVDPNVTMTTGQDPVEVAGVAGQVRRVVDQVTSALPSASGDQQVGAQGIAEHADPQSWLFMQRARYLADGSCDPYAEQMLRRMGLLPH